MTRSLALGALLLTSCANKQPIGTEDGEYTWPGGMFTMSTIDVEDQCTDGAFNTVLLPNGDEPNEWQYAIEIPSWEDLEVPMTYTISLQDPFAPMEVTVRRGSAVGEIDMNGGEQGGVVLDEDNEDCRIEIKFEKSRGLKGSETNTIDAQLIPGEQGGLTWTWQAAKEAKEKHGVSLLMEGMRCEDVAKELGVSRATVFRWQKKARDKGILQ